MRIGTLLCQGTERVVNRSSKCCDGLSNGESIIALTRTRYRLPKLSQKSAEIVLQPSPRRMTLSSRHRGEPRLRDEVIDRLGRAWARKSGPSHRSKHAVPSFGFVGSRCEYRIPQFNGVRLCREILKLFLPICHG